MAVGAADVRRHDRLQRNNYVHWSVGYYLPNHLLPTGVGLLLHWAAGAASYGWLAAPDRAHAEEWRKQLRRI